MSQRVDKGGPKFRPNVPIRRPQPPSSPAPGLSSTRTQPQPSSQPASQPTASTSARPSSQQIVAAGLRLTQPIHAPGSASSDPPAPPSTSIARPRPPRLDPPPPPPPPPSSTEPAQTQDQEQRRRRTTHVQLDEQDGDDGSDAPSDEPEQQAKRRKGPRAKRLTVAEQEAAYEDSLAQEGADMDESRVPAEELSMADLAKHEVRIGKASKRTFEMMRKYEEYKQEQKDERQLLKEKLIRKRQAGKDWIDTFGSDEEEEAEQEKRRQLRRKRKERLRKQKEKAGATGDGDVEDGQEQDDDEDGDVDVDVDIDDDPSAARVVGDGDSDDGNSMTSEEGSDEDQGPDRTASSRQKNRDGGNKKGKDKQSSATNTKKKQGKDARRPSADGQGSSSSSAHSGSGSGSDSGSDSDGDDIYGETSAAVQIRLGPDGRPVLSESSLTLDPSQLAETIDHAVEGVTAIIETERFINSNTRGKRSVNTRWNNDETDKFFRAISQWGTDFEMIARLFPTRSRHQIKLKFSREEKTNPERVNQAFKNRIPVDLEAYGVAVGRNLSGPPPQVSVKKPDDYLKMEQQERLLRAGGESGDTSAIGTRAMVPGSRKTDRRSVSAGRSDRRDGNAEEEVIVEGASDEEEDDRSVRSGSAGVSRSSSRRSVTPSRRSRSGSNAGSGPASTGRLTQRRAGGYDRERDRERARARAEEQRRERERLHRAGSSRGGGVAYESQEMVLGDADD